MGLNNNNILSKIVCIRKSSGSEMVIEIHKLYTYSDKLLILFERVSKYLLRRLLNKQENYIKGCSEIRESVLYSSLANIPFDVLHLNWVTGGFVNFKDLLRVEKPIVVTLHDSSMFTGICHVIGECENYKFECGKCPKLDSESPNDKSNWNYLLKKKYYKNLNMTFVSPSTWMAEKAKGSSLLKDKRVIIIPNGLDTQIFYPIDKSVAKRQLGLNPGKKYLVFGAVTNDDKNKGFDLLVKALETLKDVADIELITFGEGKGAELYNIHIHEFGFVADEHRLALIYSAADVSIVPSRQESFGQTASEALACGTPVVAFETSGLVDIIDHKINGYLAKPFDSGDMADGIRWCLTHNSCGKLSLNAREKVISTFDINIVSKKYRALFESLVKE